MAKRKRRWGELEPVRTADTHPRMPSIDEYEQRHPAEDTDHAFLSVDRLMARADRWRSRSAS